VVAGSYADKTDVPERLPVLILVSGPSCTGKTTLACRLGADLRLPVMTKDTIKETLFEHLGWSDRAWSRRLGGASVEVLYTFAEDMIAAGWSCIVEANFAARYATPAFQRIALRHPFHPLQVNCVAAPEVLRERFWRRSRSGERHPGHQDHLPPDRLDAPIPGRLPLLDIGGDVIELDTSDWETLDYEGLLAQIRQLI
jgi:predicted kinase